MRRPHGRVNLTQSSKKEAVVARSFGILALVMLVGLAILPRGSAGDAPPAALKLGMLENMFRDVQPAMVQAISRPFRSLFQRQTGLTGDVEIVSDAEALANKMKDHKLQLGVFHGFEYAQVRARYPDLRPLVVSIPHGRTCQACVVVHKNSKAEKIADLAGEQLVVPRGIKAHCLAYLEKAKRGLPATVAAPMPKPTQSTEDVLNTVVDGSTTAALVDVGAYNGYLNLQPGAAQYPARALQERDVPIVGDHLPQGHARRGDSQPGQDGADRHQQVGPGPSRS